MNDYSNILSAQKAFFETGKTKELDFRKKQLKKLYKYLVDNEEKIEKALWADLHKCFFESYATEMGLCRSDISLLIKKLDKLARPEKVRTPLVHFKASSHIIKEPFGQVLILAPWNYPLQLVILPLAGAIAAGNTVIIKPSEITKAVEDFIDEMMKELFPPEYITCVKGGIPESTELLKNEFDYIFFTGSSKVGKVVMEAAAKNLTPVTLELGGKNPAIVDETANIDLAARRITWGKFLNGGQTCVAPDYLFVHKNVKTKLQERIIHYIRLFYGEDIKNNPDYLRIINKQNTEKFIGILGENNIIYGGDHDLDSRFIGPTLIDEPPEESLIMQEEIFGPLLPVIAYSDLDEVFKIILQKEKPLSLYIFSRSGKSQRKIMEAISSGNVAINDAVVQYANSNLPFGGVGKSGMGSYHGRHSFYTFSHHKSVLKKSNLVDFPVRYPPYSKSKLNVLKWFLK